MLYGYARVSAKDQNTDRQLLALEAFGVLPAHIHTDRFSGKDFNRPAYQRLIRVLRPDDVLAVLSIDRLGRNYEEILSQWRYITKEKRVHIVVLDMPLLDTRRSERDLTGTFIADLVLQILSYVAETERANIKRRQAEGIRAAKLRGVRFGRPEKELSNDFPALRDAYLSGRISARAAAARLTVATNTFLRRCRAEDG